MSCSHCQERVEKSINELPGIQKVKIHLKKGIGNVKFDEKQINGEEIAKKISEAGYPTTIKA